MKKRKTVRFKDYEWEMLKRVSRKYGLSVRQLILLMALKNDSPEDIG